VIEEDVAADVEASIEVEDVVVELQEAVAVTQEVVEVEDVEGQLEAPK
jgi:hypothetical protein